MSILDKLAPFAGPLGSVVSGLFGRTSAKRQMSFQKSMASTQHQREVEDLRAAGLNPILSAGGPGAAAPGGALAPTPDFATSALSATRLEQEIRNLKAQESKTKQETQWIKNKESISGPIADLAEAIRQSVTSDAPSTAVRLRKLIGGFAQESVPDIRGMKGRSSGNPPRQPYHKFKPKR